MASLWHSYAFKADGPAVALDLGSIGVTWGPGKRVVRTEVWAAAVMTMDNLPVLTNGINRATGGWAIAVYIGEPGDGPSVPFSTEPGDFAYMALFSPGAAYPFSANSTVFPPAPTDQLAWHQLYYIPQSQTSHSPRPITEVTTLQVLLECPFFPEDAAAELTTTWGIVRVLVQDAAP